MKKTRRSAFTIVELVIVIAVIAILSAVLIPTFGAIIEDANVASDQTTAATLTTELHIFLKGKRITTEEELMKALGPKYDDGSGIGEKLVPKAGAYGQHFWFDMENQMIISATYGELLLRGEETSSVESGAQLMSLSRGVSNINVSFREILPGYLFIDSKGSAIAELLNNIDAIEDADTYNTVINSLATIEAIVATEDLDYVRALATTIQSAAIVTENYATAPANASKIYFAAGIKNIKAGGSLANLTSGTIVLPSTVDMVTTGALVFGGTGEDVTLVTSLKDADDIVTVFANGSTNAIIKTATGDYKIRNADGTFSDTASQIVDTEGNVMDGVVAESKLPYADFELFFKDVDSNNSIAHITNDGVHNVYVNYGYYAGTGRTFQIWLRPDEGADVPATNELITWNSNSDKVQVSKTGVVTITADVDTTSAPVVITATATGLGGNNIESSVNIYMDVLEYASVNFGTENYTIYNGDEYTFPWTYTNNPSYNVTVESAHYTHGKATLNNNSTLMMSANESLLTVSGGELSLVMNGASPAAKDQTVPVTLTLGDSITATVNVEVKDNREAVFTHGFRWNSAVADNNGAFRRYYVGSNQNTPVNLSYLVGYETFEACTVTVNGFKYDGSAFRSIDHEIYEDYGLSATITGATGVSKSIANVNDWNATQITFTGVSPSIADGNGVATIRPIIIEVKPADTNKAPTLIEIVLVDAVNIITDDSAALANALKDKSAVLFSNITVSDINTKLEVGSKGLYGNGHVISALKYVARPNGDIWYTDEYLINLTDNGIVENLYLDGPVYPYAQFNTNEMLDACGFDEDNAKHLMYVSGIKMTGTCTLSNSYVSGFRQPVQVNGDTTTKTKLDNVTLYGGSFCNLSIMSGDVLLNNITTVQEVQTVAAKAFTNSSKTYIVGLGIVAETGAKDSDITITGKLMQYNWLNKADSKRIPTLRIYTNGAIKGSVFNTYVYESAFAELTSKFLKSDASGTKYMNTGIVYMLSNPNGVTNYTVEDIDGECKWEGSNIDSFTPFESSIIDLKKWIDDKIAAGASGYLWTGAQSVLNTILADINIAARVYTYGETVTNFDGLVAPGDVFANSGNYYVGYSK